MGLDNGQRKEDLERISAALDAAAEILAEYTPGAIAAEKKAGGSPVTEADRRVDDALRSILPREGEGWLSEETVDEPSRLAKSRVWVVDPIDGTIEFVSGIPEWCVSIGLVEDGRAVAGGIFNPSADERVIGSLETGVTLNGEPARVCEVASLDRCRVLASRSELKRGEWERFRDAPFEIVPMGSVAYKLSRVAAGLSEATWTLVPKHEWDVAAGTALVTAAGGVVMTLDGGEPRFNREKPKFDGLIAVPPGIVDELTPLLALPERR
ncbi:MAG: 3'(2'),5'-bisphosphate nucleotidase CysQ [bacterium]|nr:3'(2'),5'-bisphosphate nucleotidase CysQ [bacterium]